MDYKTVIDNLVNELDTRGGSDIHLNVGFSPSLRVDGELIFVDSVPVLTSDDVSGFIKIILTPENNIRYQENHDLDFSFRTTNGIRLRGNAYLENGDPAVALRRIPIVKNLSELGLPPKIKEFAMAKQGFFLVVGPMGQGKSTVMAAMVEEINTNRSAHIVTIEDPIEFTFENKKSIIDQREVGIDTESFDAAMKSVFREDANVILIGEMRTTETMSAAVTAAETGHLVISTLHTNTAVQTIDRIIDSFPSGQQDQIRMQLASSLIGVLSLRLIPKINGGRVMAYELLIVTPAVANLIREKRTHEIQILVETGMEHGMVDMNRILVDLIERGEIALDTAVEYSTNPEALKGRYK